MAAIDSTGSVSYYGQRLGAIKGVGGLLGALKVKVVKFRTFFATFCELYGAVSRRRIPISQNRCQFRNQRLKIYQKPSSNSSQDAPRSFPNFTSPDFINQLISPDPEELEG